MDYPSCCSWARGFRLIFGFGVRDLTRFSKKTLDLTWVVTLHFMKRKNRGHDWEVVLKLDISKTYGRVEWAYLKHRMKIMGFSNT